MAIKKSKSPAKSTEPTYEIIHEVGVLSTNSRGWEKKLCYVSWNGEDPKYDLRSWCETEDGIKMSKGITLTGEELEALYYLIQKEMESPEEEAK